MNRDVFNDVLEHLKARAPDEENVRYRLRLNSGDVIAGSVSSLKYLLDVFIVTEPISNQQTIVDLSSVIAVSLDLPIVTNLSFD